MIRSVGLGSDIRWDIRQGVASGSMFVSAGLLPCFPAISPLLVEVSCRRNPWKLSLDSILLEGHIGVVLLIIPRAHSSVVRAPGS